MKSHGAHIIYTLEELYAREINLRAAVMQVSLGQPNQVVMAACLAVLILSMSQDCKDGAAAHKMMIEQFDAAFEQLKFLFDQPTEQVPGLSELVVEEPVVQEAAHGDTGGEG